MISGAKSHCFPCVSQGLQMFPIVEDVVSPSIEGSCGSETHSNSLLYSLSLLKEKVHQVQSLVSRLIMKDQTRPESASLAIASMGTTIQEIIVTASSMMFTCQQLAVGLGSSHSTDDHVHQPYNKAQESVPSQPNYCAAVGQERGQSFLFSSDQAFDWYGDNSITGNMHVSSDNNCSKKSEMGELPFSSGQNSGEGIIELDAANLLAKYTHYCHVCGKGFKRDANLRMHMRAHGDEYKTSAALSNPAKHKQSGSTGGEDSPACESPMKYSCPHEGCRWNQKHAKFQPLKSMICVKNHYRRSHCPKMYVCKRCNRKNFSVLSDLRTHEKHCGNLKWRCSCGTTFSRKDKLMGHVTLFVGHTPVRKGDTDIQAIGMQQYDRG